MEPDELDDESWRRLARVFFAPPPSPTAEQTEAFVARVLAGLPAEAPESSFVRWLARPWLVPALGLALATLFVVIGGVPPEPPAPLDAWLLTNSRTQDVARLAWLPTAAPMDGEP